MAEHTVAPSRGRGSKRIGGAKIFGNTASPLHGGVDRNCEILPAEHLDTSRPFTGAWIETFLAVIGHQPFACRPFTGAWIETARGSFWTSLNSGRPFTGAWIETLHCGPAGEGGPVAPSRGRGSKPGALDAVASGARSPLHGGVDRNADAGYSILQFPVAPSRGRGSKRSSLFSRAAGGRVAPSRGRGSKRVFARLHRSPDRRPFTGAWIETYTPAEGIAMPRVAPSRGRGSKPITDRLNIGVSESPLHGGVDRNYYL